MLISGFILGIAYAAFAFLTGFGFYFAIRKQELKNKNKKQ